MTLRNDHRYRASEEWYQRALKTIPLGAQTFSKSPVQLPKGAAPFFVTRGKGGHVWDIDGNEYVDMVMGLHAVLLGYADPDVDAAVMRQMQDGVVFTLAHPIEARVAEAIVDIVPCAEMVRFGKNGSDATTGAIRLARAFTGRDRVAVGGYHGWHDWYIGSTTRNRGVPQATCALTHRFDAADPAALEALLSQHPGEFAAIIMEVMNAREPAPGALEEIRAITRRHGALLIFDEIITGFRFALGGAQSLYGVTPDLATFGKGLANGYPLSAIVGRADVMKLLEEVFFSFTMGGETLSLAAAEAVLAKLKREPVIDTMAQRGRKLTDGLQALIDKNDAGEFMSLSGNPVWSFVNLADTNGCTTFDIKTLWMQEMLVRGILSTGTHNLCYAHTDSDMDAVLAAYEEVLPILRQAVSHGSVRPFLKNCEPLVPLFKVR